MIVLEWMSGLPWPLVLLVLLMLSLITFEIASSRTKHFDTKDRSNDSIGHAALGLLSGAFIFVGAFTVITSWNEADQMRAAAQTEVITGQSLMREVGLLAPMDTTVSAALGHYAETVMKDETGAGGTLEPSMEAADDFVSLEMATVAVVQDTTMDDVEAKAVMDSLNDMKLAREARVGDLTSKLTLPLVGLLAIMALINVIAIGLVPSGHSRGLKRAFGVTVAVAVACILTGVVVLESVSFIHPRLAAPVANLISDANSH